MSASPKTYISEMSYLQQERKAESKNGYYKGEIFAMVAVSKEHNKIAGSIIKAIGNHLEGKKCTYFPSDIRVHNPLNTLFTYPDITIVCGEEAYKDEEFETLLNPTVIFEVLSPHTEGYDRGTKFMLYRSIPSLQNYVMVSSTDFLAEVYTRSGDSWILTTTKGRDGNLHISAIDLDLSLSEAYEQIDKF